MTPLPVDRLGERGLEAAAVVVGGAVGFAADGAGAVPIAAAVGFFAAKSVESLRLALT